MFASQSGGASHRHPDKVCKHNKVSKTQQQTYHGFKKGAAIVPRSHKKRAANVPGVPNKVRNKKVQSYKGVKKKIANVLWFHEMIAADVPAFPNKVCKRTRVSKTKSCKRTRF